MKMTAFYIIAIACTALGFAVLGFAVGKYYDEYSEAKRVQQPTQKLIGPSGRSELRQYDYIMQKDGWEGSAVYDSNARMWRGKILHIKDLVTYTASNQVMLRYEFEAAIRDYIDTKQRAGFT